VVLKAETTIMALEPSQTSGRKFLSYDDLVERGIRFSRVHLRRLERAGNFPHHVELGTGNSTQTMIAWLLDEVETWELQRVAVRDRRP
jgi:prophage regulatory protein